MGELKLIVDSRDFGSFAGFKYTDDKYKKNNERLNEYIKLYSSNADIKYLQIECGENLPMHTIAYICEKVKEKYFIRVDYGNSVEDKRYWLCFYKDRPQPPEAEK